MILQHCTFVFFSSTQLYSVSSIEYTPELMIFDLLSVPLFHGWIVSPDDRALRDAVQNFSYNQIVEFIITHSCDAHSMSTAPAPAAAAQPSTVSQPTSSPAASPSAASDPVAASAAASDQSTSAAAAAAPAATNESSTSTSNARDAERAMLCHEFLDQTAWQLTFDGINELQVWIYFNKEFTF